MRDALVGSAIVAIVGGVLSLTGAHIAAQSAPAAQRPPGQSQAPIAGCPVGVPNTFGKNREWHQCALEKAKTFTPARTPDGVPDLQGLWRARLTSFFSAEGFDEGDPRTTNPVQHYPLGPTQVVDPATGKIPYQPWAAKLRDFHWERFLESNARCQFSTPPRDMAVSPINQIIQPQGGRSVTWLSEESHIWRTIPTDGRPHLGKSIKLWNGDPVGHWEGHTLVIDITNLNGYGWFDVIGNFYTEQAHMVERWTPVDADTIDYEVTITDPQTYTQPWKMAFALVRSTAPRAGMLEESCWEGDRDLPTFRALGWRSYFGETHRGKVPVPADARPPDAR